MTTISSCGIYSFTGASIDSNVKTVRVQTFVNQASLVVPSLSQKLTLELKKKFTTGTNLVFVDGSDADLDFYSVITNYTITPQAALAGETAALTRITVVVTVDFKNNKNDKQSGTKSYTKFADFDSNLDVNAVQDALLDDISEQIADLIFNDAVVNW